MRKRILGKTGFEVSVIGFGGIYIQSSGYEEAVEVLEAAFRKGINFFDTARCYTDSEDKMSCLSVYGKELYMATKTLARDAAGLRQDLEESLAALGRERIDLYQLHNVSREEELKKVLAKGGALQEARRAQEEGLVGEVGISSHNLDVSREAVETGEFSTLQIPVNIVERHYLDQGLIQRAAELDIGVIAMKPLGGGPLLPASYSLRFALQAGSSLVIPGMRTLKEVRENAKVGEEPEPLQSGELAELEKLAEKLGSDFCRRCQYCMPCPEGIYIPQVFICVGTWRWGGEPERAKELYGRTVPVPASACVDCGECEEKCPYGLPIPEMLKEAADLLE